MGVHFVRAAILAGSLAALPAACGSVDIGETSSSTGAGAGTAAGGGAATSTSAGDTASSSSTATTSTSSTTSGSTSASGSGGASGCGTDADCAVDPATPHCDLATGDCVACAVDDDCGPGTLCSANHVCVPGCTATHACGAGLSCCGSTCVDTTQDLANCGSCAAPCGTAPHATIACQGSLCTWTACDAGFADCDGQPADGCEHNLLQDDACTCAPGQAQACYLGLPSTEGVGPCHAGTRICAPNGLGFGACQGQVLPISEICGNAVDDDCNGLSDDVGDLDGDGWTRCDGDCAETSPGGSLVNPAEVNPGAIEIVGDGIDNDCDPATTDQSVSPTCSSGTLVAGVTPLDLAMAMDICQLAVPSPPLDQKKPGLLDATFLLADGSAPSAAQLDTMVSLQTAVIAKFGDAIVPHKGLTMAGLSTGKMRDAHSADFVPSAPGTDLGSTSSPPAVYLAAHGGLLPSSSGCNGACPNGAGAFDSVRLRLTLRAPTNAHGFSLDFGFFSAEYGARSCSPYNDAFLALLQTQTPGIPLDTNIAFDLLGNPLLANALLFEQCEAQGCNICPFGPAQLAGTGMESGGATRWLTIDAPLLPGDTFQLDLMIFDVTDGSGDSHVLLDNFRWHTPPPPCQGGYEFCG